MPSRFPACLCALMLLDIVAGRAVQAAAVPLRTPGRSAILQVMADLTLIDGACRDIVVDFGVVFHFAAAQGIADAAVLPGGVGRAAFEAALRARRASFDHDELCGEIAENYAEALPGSVTFRPSRVNRP